MFRAPRASSFRPAPDRGTFATIRSPLRADGMARASIDEETLAGGAHLVVVTGELDMASTGGLRRRLEAALIDHAPRLVVDLTAVTHMDSSGLAELLSAHQRAA